MATPYDMAMRAASAAGNVLDLPGSSVRDVLAGQNPFDQYLTPLSDTNRTSGRQLLQGYGLAGPTKTWGNFAGGLATEMATDPMNLLGARLLAKAFKGAKAAKQTNTAIRAANTKSLSQRASGFMPEEVAELTKISHAPGQPTKMFHGGGNIDFDTYDLNKASPDSLYGKGIYSTNDPLIAGEPGGYWEKGHSVQKRIHPEHLEDYLQMRLHGMRRMQAPSSPPLTPEYIAKRLDDSVETPIALDRSMSHMVYNDPSPAGVKMHYIDSRKPFDLDQVYTTADFPGEQALADLPPGGLPGTSLYNRMIDDEMLRRHGYDALTHTGGRVLGGKPHTVVIAKSPEQMYLPYIAKRIQQEVPVPKVLPTAAGVAGYNLVRRKKRSK